MKKLLPFILIIFFVQQPFAQFRFDNKLYKTIFWEDFCKTLLQQKDYLLLDVRSKGEFADTSVDTQLNLGHLRGAMNIDIQQLPDSLDKLNAFKKKTIFVYCSHSQRSRRASKLLSEKGFNNVININGGMTIFNLMKSSKIPCLQSIYKSDIPYRLLSPRQLCVLLAKDDNVFLLDVRKDSSFNSLSGIEALDAYGKFRNSVNIPLNKLLFSLDQIPRNKDIIVIDNYGNESTKAASLLSEKGYKSVSVLLNGLDQWASSDPSELDCKNQWLVRNAQYGLITPEELSKFESHKDLLIIDIRSDSDYHNISKYNWRNIGNLKQAVNIPAGQLSNNINQLKQFKNKPVVIYGFSSSPGSFSSAKLLCNNGFSKVYVLMGGLFHIRWQAANLKDHAYLNELVTNIPNDNL